MDPLIKITKLSASYGGNVVLHDIDLTIYKNDFLGIIGPNGGGKTTLIKCILGLIKPRSGSIRYYDAKGKEINHLTIGYLPQYNIIDKKFPISVEEVILSGLSVKKSWISSYNLKDRQKAKTIIERMGLVGLEKRMIGQLSGGQMQRALLGRAIISEPSVVILDEPSTYVDKSFEKALYKLLGEINNDCAIILVSHDIGTILQEVKSVACVNETLDYHSDAEVTTEWMEKNFNCPIELVGHGDLPHRVLGEHHS